MHLLNWQLVRLLSSLSLLNRLAFSMLLVVPLLAALWNPMRVATQQYNDVVKQARQDIGIPPVVTEAPPKEGGIAAPESADTTSESNQAPSTENSALEQAIITPDNSVAIDQAVRDESLLLLPPRLRQLLNTWFPRVVGKPTLPRPWALAFFAALLILLGDTTVQIVCPKVVRDFGREDYVREETDRFAKAPSLLVLSRATDYLKELNTHEELLTEGLGSRAPGASDSDHEQSAAPATSPSPKNQTEFYDLARRIAIVEAASRARYIALADTRRLGALLSLICYLVSGCVIIKILQEQALNIARASGWTH